jgi:hypothetical protein
VNALQKTLAIIALLLLVPQSVRHAYRLWLEPRSSVLDKYDQPLKGEIEGARSLEELVARYDKVRKEVDAKKQERLQQGPKERVYVDELQTEPYKSEIALRSAIIDWEKKSAEIRELRSYWFVGLVLLALGLVIYRRFNRWFGLSLVIIAFSEFIYWTSPTFFGSGGREYDRLLVNKLVFTVVSLLLLLPVIWLSGAFGALNHGKEQAKP